VELEKIKTLEEFQAWINHPYTIKVFNFLEQEEKANATNASSCAYRLPINTEGALINLHSMETIRKLKDKLKKPLVNLIIVPQESNQF